MLTRSLLSAVFCLLPIILQPLPVAAESILLDGRMTTTTRPWLDKRARQWLEAREPLTIGVVSPDCCAVGAPGGACVSTSPG